MATQKKSNSKVKEASAQAGASRVMKAQDFALSSEQKPEVSAKTFACYIRALDQNSRQGTVGCKDRGEVAFSNKKPWKQKGTGRARAGTRRSPLWRKGGVIFGPQPRVRKLKVSQSTKRNVLNALFWQQLEHGNIIALDWNLGQEIPKTALAFKALKEAQLHDKKIVLFVSHEDALIHASFNNIPNVRMLLFDQPNALALADSDCWVFLDKDTENFKQMVSPWI